MKGRRFVAGAICPQCGERDTLFIQRSNEKQQRECVRCGHQGEMPRHGPQVVLPTRVESGTDKGEEISDVQVLNLPKN